MNNNNQKDGERKPPKVHLVKGGKGEKKPDAKTNAQLAAEAMDRLARGEANAHDMIILQRYLLKKPS